jgi:hypothetical protein
MWQGVDRASSRRNSYVGVSYCCPLLSAAASCRAFLLLHEQQRGVYRTLPDSCRRVMHLTATALSHLKITSLAALLVAPGLLTRPRPLTHMVLMPRVS